MRFEAKNRLLPGGGGEKKLDLIVAFWENNQFSGVAGGDSWAFVLPLGIKITIEYWHKKHKMFENIAAFWEKTRFFLGGGVEHMWHLLGSNSHYITLLLTKKVENMLDFIECVLRKKITSGGGRGGSWAFVPHFGIKITIDYRPKSRKKCSIV